MIQISNRAVFLDRDGVINEVIYHNNVNKPSSPWKIEDFKLIPDIKKPLNQLSNEGYMLFIISNQPDISRGFIENGTTEKINKIIKSTLPIDDIVICPHDDHHNCDCRKPKPGMIIELSRKYDIDLKKSFLIGDSWKDIKAGKETGCITILIKKEYNKNVVSDHTVNTLQQAVDKILNITKKRLKTSIDKIVIHLFNHPV